MGENLALQLYLFLANAIDILNADKGNVQVYDENKKTLNIVAHIGFNDEFLSLFQSVGMENGGACVAALKRRERIIVEDTSKDPSFDGLGSTSKRFGFAAVKCTPLFDGNGKFFGILSIHFKKPHRPSAEELDLLDRYLSQAVLIIAQKWREAKTSNVVKF
ncbi:MAG: GAF domain-containing protein [Candidatus Omnitrophica bacterium]|nr:GAF domain-containing protein [Candidatus Omnitrophota bacterium]